MKQWRIIILLSFIGILTYLPSFSGQLFWDDKDFITQNEYVKNFQIDKFFTAQAVEGSGKVSNYFRPLQFSLYAVMYNFFGHSPLAFHTLSIVAHIAATISVYIFFTMLFSKFMIHNSQLSPLNSYIPALISLLFLVHPVQTEAVSYVSGFSDPLVALLGFTTLTTFLLAHRKELKISWLLISFFAFLCTLLAKENGIIFGGILFLLAFYFNILKERNLLRFFITVAPIFLLILGYLLYHTHSIDVTDMKLLYGEAPYTNSILVRLSMFFSLLPTYIGILFVPYTLFYERDFTIHILNSPWNSTSIITGITIVVLFFILLIRPKQHLKIRSYYSVFLFLSFFISFIPYTGLVLINGIMYEHFLYIPLIFFFAFCILLINEYVPKRYYTGILLLLISYFLLLIVRSWFRQLDWRDPIRLYRQTLVHAPNSFRVRNNLGMALQEQGNSDAAMQEYTKVIELNPQIPNAYHNIGNIYFEKKEYKDAEAYYRKAIAVEPYFGYSYAALLKLYQITGEQDKLQKISADITTRFKQ